ncbi:MAG TPA: TonB-dependent receptor [Longimicrobium sp.]|jgi:TonB-linked SusC/RagA family outer membrane protein|uniref:SusC/RagA family TonB-linked outer membrane protein n=1 Tax=Longimicrobium sp. TaxID=2029185 RepID=UPI002EDABCFB
MKNPVVSRAGLAARLLLRAFAFLALLAGLPLHAQSGGRITGQVVSAANGSPVADAQVSVVGTRLTGRTGPDGRYTINGVPAGQYQVRAGQMGFASTAVSVTVAEGATAQADFRLGTQTLMLDTLVAVGYTTQRRTTVSDAVAEVRAEDIQDRQVATLEEALRGRVAGVVIQSSGQPGRESQVNIRGQNFLSGSSPLYVVDGMYTRQNPNLNPRDIESVQVLKDASAAAQYGAQSANGVILITTRRGRAGAPKVAVNSYYGFQEVPRRVDLVDAARWSELNNMARTNAGLPADNTAITANTNWQDAVFQQGAVQDHNVAVSGGSDNANYLIGGGYFNQQGTIIDTDFERFSFRVNSEARGGRWRVGQNATLSRSTRNNLVGFPLVDAVRLQPGIPVYDPNNPSGYGYGSGNGALATFGSNPVGAFEREDNNEITNRVLGSVFGEYSLTSWLRYRVNLGVDYEDLNYTRFQRQQQIRQNTVPTFNEARERRDNNMVLLMEHLLNFEQTRGEHSLSGVTGVTQQTGRFERLEAYRRGFADEDITQIDAGTSNFANRGFEIPSGLVGLLLRANYSYADRYLLTGTVRRDGSSRFGPGNKYGTFVSGSAGWVVSDEPFYQNLPFLGSSVPSLKLRASYGSLGNQDIGDFQYAASIISNQSYLFGGAIASGATQLRLANPDIRWQDQTQTNVGLEFGVLNDALRVTADYYVSNSDGLLVSPPIPWSLGTGFNDPTAPPTVNAGSVRNRGFELGAEWTVNRGDLQLVSSANITTINNEVLGLGNGGQPIFAGFNNVSRTAVGGGIGDFYLIKTDGLFQSDAEVQAHRNKDGKVIQPNARPGDIRYVDLNGDGTINDDDRYVAGSPIPDFEGGLSLNATYRAFNVGLALRGAQGAEIFNVVRYWTDRMDENSNYRADLDPWTPTNTNTRDPRAVFGAAGADNARANTDRWLEDGSYLRVQNLVVGYRLPASLTSRLGVAGEGSRIYLNVQNLHTFSRFSNWDPEVLNADRPIGDGTPDTRVDPLARGIDDGRIYPNPRTFTLGIDLSL